MLSSCSSNGLSISGFVYGQEVDKAPVELYPIISASRSRDCELQRALYFLLPQILVIYSLSTLNFASQIARSCNKNAGKKEDR